MSRPPDPQLLTLARIGLNSPKADRLAQFYTLACGARLQTHDRLEQLQTNGFSGLSGGAERTVLILGDAILELWTFDEPGRPYPQGLSPDDTRFQHIAIVVVDMEFAMERLHSTEGWSTISTGGPQTLPQSAGGVTAFKFRDPDGHPVEFLQFPSGNIPTYWQSRAASRASEVCCGVDHSAISVADLDTSIRFYQSLGLHVSVRTLNQGSAQTDLDGIPTSIVDVIGLAPPHPTPHIELLHYHTEQRPRHQPLAANDVAATRLICTSQPAANVRSDALIQDPDGHWLQILTSAQTQPA